MNKLKKIADTFIRLAFLAFGIYCGILFMDTDNSSIGWQVAEVVGGVGLGAILSIIFYHFAGFIVSFIKGDF